MLLAHLSPQIAFPLVFLRMLFLITGFMSCTITPRNYNTNLMDAKQISMTTVLPEDLFCCRGGFQDPCAKRHTSGKVGLKVSQWHDAERAFKHYRKAFAAVIRWESSPDLNVTSMDLPDHEGNPYLPFSDRMTKAGVCCLPPMSSVPEQAYSPWTLREWHICQARERRLTADTASPSPTWIELVEKWYHYRPRRFSKRKILSSTLSCSSSCIKNCFPANKMRHNFLRAVCGDSAISLAGSQAPTGQEPQRAQDEAPGLPGFSFIPLGILFFPLNLSLILPPLSLRLFIYSLNLDIYFVPQHFQVNKKGDAFLGKKAVNSLTEGEANGTFLNKAAGSIAAHPAGLLGQSRLVSKRARTEFERWGGLFWFFFSFLFLLLCSKKYLQKALNGNAKINAKFCSCWI